LRPASRHATNARVSTGTGDSVAANAAGSFASDWQALRADEQIQFAPLAMPERQPPGWLDELLQSLGRYLGPAAGPMLWILAGLGVAVLAFVLWQALAPLVKNRREGRAEPADPASPEWSPDTREALALLDEADRLAGEGRYDEATHLLLRRSVGQIAAARPGLLEPSSTAREISVLPALPEAARGAFAVIAGRVERSLFALRSLSADDWRAARAAYADFALAAPSLA
jgi:hypothetical protein